MPRAITRLVAAMIICLMTAHVSNAVPPVVVAAGGAVARRTGIWLLEQTASWAFGKVLDRTLFGDRERELKQTLQALRKQSVETQAQLRTMHATHSGETEFLRRQIAEEELQQIRRTDSILSAQLTLLRKMATQQGEAEAAARERDALIRWLRQLDDAEQNTQARVAVLEQRINQLERQRSITVNLFF